MPSFHKKKEDKEEQEEANLWLGQEREGWRTSLCISMCIPCMLHGLGAGGQDRAGRKGQEHGLLLCEEGGGRRNSVIVCNMKKEEEEGQEKHTPVLCWKEQRRRKEGTVYACMCAWDWDWEGLGSLEGHVAWRKDSDLLFSLFQPVFLEEHLQEKDTRKQTGMAVSDIGMPLCLPLPGQQRTG